MSKKISLKNEVDINGQKVNELNLNFDNLTGNDLLVAEETARTLGDKTPAICYSMRYQAIIGAKAANVAIDDIQMLKGNDYLSVIAEVNNFLFG